MRIFLIAAIMGSVTVGLSEKMYAKEVSEQRSWSQTYSVVAAPNLVIDNIWGSIRIRPGKSGEIKVKVDEIRSAPNQKRFDKSREILQLHVDTDPGNVSMVVGQRDSWHRFNPCRGCQLEYQFDVEVPVDTNLTLSTVNDGHIDVDGIFGVVNARNVNGAVRLSGLADCSLVESVNGPVRIKFSRAPQTTCDIETINGDVSLGLPDDTNLDLAFDLFNGRLRSDMEVQPVTLPAKIEEQVSEDSTKFRIEQPMGVRIGAGGTRFSVSSMNGDVRIVRIQ